MKKLIHVGMKMQISKLTIIIGALTFFILAIFLSWGCNDDYDDWYITPNEYKGKVTVLFDQQGGAPVKLFGHKHIFEIPRSGILITQAKPNSGFSHSDKFFRRLVNGRLVEMMNVSYATIDPTIYNTPAPMVMEDSFVVESLDGTIIIPDYNSDSVLTLSYLISYRQ